MCVKKKVTFHTFGCKLNFSESSAISMQFEDNGFERVRQSDNADIYVINTCSVTDHADKKCRSTIRKIAKNNPSSIIAVTGCYAQLKPQEIAAIDGVDIVIGNNDKGNIFEMVKGLSKGSGAIYHTCQAEELTSFFAAFSSSERTRAFLKVQDGCNYKCSYCTIPLARGNSRNISIDSITSEANAIAAKGIKEIVLTGVNIGDFGRSTDETFLDLLKSLDKVEGIQRYRISSIEPNLLTEDILCFTSLSDKFQPHFHIPLQSGSDKILKLMRRRYNTYFFEDKIKNIRNAIADVFIGIDVIVGFLSESDEDFEDTYRFLERVQPAFIHIFPYSQRDNTDAVKLDDKVSPIVSAQRVKRLEYLCEKLHTQFIERYVNSRRNVLVEGTKKGNIMFGYTDNYIRVELPYNKDMINRIIPVDLISVKDNTLIGCCMPK